MLLDVGRRGRECVRKAVYKQEKVAAPRFDSECNLSSANASSQQNSQSQHFVKISATLAVTVPSSHTRTGENPFQLSKEVHVGRATTVGLRDVQDTT